MLCTIFGVAVGMDSTLHTPAEEAPLAYQLALRSFQRIVYVEFHDMAFLDYLYEQTQDIETLVYDDLNGLVRVAQGVHTLVPSPAGAWSMEYAIDHALLARGEQLSIYTFVDNVHLSEPKVQQALHRYARSTARDPHRYTLLHFIGPATPRNAVPDALRSIFFPVSVPVVSMGPTFPLEILEKLEANTAWVEQQLTYACIAISGDSYPKNSNPTFFKEAVVALTGLSQYGVRMAIDYASIRYKMTAQPASLPWKASECLNPAYLREYRTRWDRVL